MFGVKEVVLFVLLGFFLILGCRIFFFLDVELLEFVIFGVIMFGDNYYEVMKKSVFDEDFGKDIILGWIIL